MSGIEEAFRVELAENLRHSDGDNRSTERLAALIGKNLPHGIPSLSTTGDDFECVFDNGLTFTASKSRGSKDGTIECVFIFHPESQTCTLQRLDDRFHLMKKTASSTNLAGTKLLRDESDHSRETTASPAKKPANLSSFSLALPGTSIQPGNTPPTINQNVSTPSTNPSRLTSSTSLSGMLEVDPILDYEEDSDDLDANPMQEDEHPKPQVNTPKPPQNSLGIALPGVSVPKSPEKKSPIPLNALTLETGNTKPSKKRKSATKENGNQSSSSSSSSSSSGSSSSETDSSTDTSDSSSDNAAAEQERDRSKKRRKSGGKHSGRPKSASSAQGSTLPSTANAKEETALQPSIPTITQQAPSSQDAELSSSGGFGHSGNASKGPISLTAYSGEMEDDGSSSD